MPIGTSDGEYYDDQESYLLKEYLDTPGENKRTTELPKGSLGPSERLSTNIEDDRNKPHSMDELSSMATDSLRHVADPFMWAGKKLNQGVDATEAYVGGLGEAGARAFMLPGEVAKGNVDPLSDEAKDWAAGMAMNMVGAPGPKPEGALGSFIGVKAKTFDKPSAMKASLMKMRGHSPEEIWNETRMFQGAEGRWRAEVPNDEAKLNLTGTRSREESLTGLEEPFIYADRNKQIGINDSAGNVKLHELLDHPELYKAYPFLKDINILPIPPEWPSTIRGAMLPGQNTIVLGKAPEAEMRSTLLHEVQHSIQEHEGFAGGGHKAMFEHPDFQTIKDQHAELKADLDQKIKDKGEDPAVFSNLVLKHKIDQSLLSKDTIKDLDEFKKNNPSIYKEILDSHRATKGIQDLEARYYNRYRSLAGEVEARNVQYRLGDPKETPMEELERLVREHRFSKDWGGIEPDTINKEVLRKTIPTYTEDVPRHEQIVKQR